MSHVLGPRTAAPSTNACRASAAASSRSVPHLRCEEPQTPRKSEFQPLLSGKRQGLRATFIQVQLPCSRRSHNALLLPPKGPAPFFRGQRGKREPPRRDGKRLKQWRIRGGFSLALWCRFPHACKQVCAGVVALVRGWKTPRIFFTHSDSRQKTPKMKGS